MEYAVFTGESFELCFVDHIAWARLWWSNEDRHIRFDRPLVQRIHDVATRRPCQGLVLDLREAPPIASFAARRKLQAILQAAVSIPLPTMVLVGGSSVQYRDATRIIPPGADVRVTRNRIDVFDWLDTHARAS